MQGNDLDTSTTCRVDSQQQAATLASVTSRVESADKSAASARAEAETLRTQMDPYKQVQQQQNGAIQMPKTPSATT